MYSGEPQDTHGPFLSLFLSCLFPSFCNALFPDREIILFTEASFQFRRSVMSDSLQPHRLQHIRLPCPSPIPGACSNSCPSSQWCHPTISSSVILFFSCLQCLPASGSFPGTQFFASGGQSIGASVSASVLPMNIQDWFPLGLNGWISLQSKELSRVFSSTTVQNHIFMYVHVLTWQYNWKIIRRVESWESLPESTAER